MSSSPVADLLTLSLRVSPATLERKKISAASICDLIFSVPTRSSWPQVRVRTWIDLALSHSQPPIYRQIAMANVAIWWSYHCMRRAYMQFWVSQTGHLPHSSCTLKLGGFPRGTPRAHWRDYISHLAWQHIRICQGELEKGCWGEEHLEYSGLHVASDKGEKKRMAECVGG